MERWKSVVGYIGLYEVSDRGNVRSVEREINTAIRHNTRRMCNGKMLKRNLGTKGYYKVDLCKDGKVNTVNVHRLVAEAFIPNPNNLRVVNHINGIKTDNAVENLEWVSYQENHWHARESGLLTQIGQQNNKSICCVETGNVFENSVRAAEWLIDTKNPHIRKPNIKPIARCIRAASSGKVPRAYGYHWKDV